MLPEVAPGLGISASGLEAERMRIEIAAHNLANVNSTKDVEGGVFQRRQAVFTAMYDEAIDGESRGLKGVKIDNVIRDDAAPVSKYMPWHPEADGNGYVQLPNISSMVEMLDIMTATRAYEANLSAMRQAKTMFNATIDLLKA